MFASVALASLQVAIDRPYDYRIPDSLQDGVVPGTRVFVPFGSGNRVTEAFVLALSEESGYPDCKEILRIADEKPLLGREQLQLAYFMRERYFCTVYQALRTMLPAGFWLDKSGKRRNRDASLELVRLAVSADEASEYAGEKRRRSHRQAEILDLLCS
ncbi:MAG: primosomal protein N', partial [Oscillospiraceae bacterium]|nr:primosomal protein N' [Oscillospiraceae bacterium]